MNAQPFRKGFYWGLGFSVALALVSGSTLLVSNTFAKAAQNTNRNQVVSSEQPDKLNEAHHESISQAPNPDFVLVIEAPQGSTRIECVAGCELLHWRSAANPNATKSKSFSYACSSPSNKKCAAKVAGWRDSK